MAAGLYTNSWDPYNGTILISNDKGATFTQSNLPFKVGGNMPGRGMGERLAVDPNLPNVLFFGARSGNGLWKSTNSGLTWSKVSGLPDAGTYAPDPSDSSGYNSQKVGVAFVTFDSTSASSGTATPRIFVGVASFGVNNVYMSTNGGSSFTAISGFNTSWIPHKAVLSPSEKVGQYCMLDELCLISSHFRSSTSALLMVPARTMERTAASTSITSLLARSQTSLLCLEEICTSVSAALRWTCKSPGHSWWLHSTAGGQTQTSSEGACVCTAWHDRRQDRSHAPCHCSTNGGTTWTRLWEWNGYPTLNRYYKYDNTLAPWTGPGYNLGSDVSVSQIGWMIEALVIDPFDR